MLPRRLRLSRRAFPTGGARLATPHFSVVLGPSRAGGAAAVVSKKVARRAVARNLLRRRMLEVMGPHVSPERYLVVYAKAGSPSLPFKALAAELDSLLSRIPRTMH